MGKYHLSSHTIITTKYSLLCFAQTQSGVISIRLRTMVDAHFERVHLNVEYCFSRIPSLRKFYFCAILPELAFPKDPIREPREWIVNKEDWLQEISSL